MLMASNSSGLKRLLFASAAASRVETVSSGNTPYSSVIAQIQNVEKPQKIEALTVTLPYNSSGYSGTSVTRCGKNLFDHKTLQSSAITTLDNDKSEFYGTLTSLYSEHPWDTSGVFYCAGIERFTWSMGAYNTGNVSATGNGMQPALTYYTNEKKVKVLYTYPNETTDWLWKKISSAGYQTPLGLYFSYYSAPGNVWHIREFQVELGDDATGYEKFTGNKYTAAFPETVYGGAYDFISGKLISQYAADGSEITPVTYQLEPTAIKTIPGVNNIWSYDGGVIVKYRTHLSPTHTGVQKRTLRIYALYPETDTN